MAGVTVFVTVTVFVAVTVLFAVTVFARWLQTKFHSIFLPEYDLHKLEQFA